MRMYSPKTHAKEIEEETQKLAIKEDLTIHEQLRLRKLRLETDRLEDRIQSGWLDFREMKGNLQVWIYLCDRSQLKSLNLVIPRLITQGLFDNCELKGFKTKDYCGVKITILAPTETKFLFEGKR